MMASQTVLNSDNICRICAEAREQYISIFEEQGMELSLLIKIKTHLSIKVEMSDNLPHKVCDSCIYKLNICHELFQTAKEADLKLRNLFSNSDSQFPGNSIIVQSFSIDNLSDEKTGEDVHFEISITDSIEVVKEVENNQQHSQAGVDEAIGIAIDNVDSFELGSSSNKLMKLENLIESNKDYTLSNVYESPPLHENVECNSGTKVDISEVEPKEIHNSHMTGCEDHSDSAADETNVDNEREVPNLICLQCGKVCKTSKGLDVHMSTHSNVQPFLCDLCGKKFKHENSLRCHKRTHLEDSLKKRHCCNLCEKTFRSKFHLSEHMNVHNGVTPYKCPSCDKLFHRRVQLRQHASTHISEKDKSVCDTCGVKFTRRSNLLQHVKKCHAENRTFKCRICNHEFPILSQLLSHRSSHAQEKGIEQHSSSEDSYTCHICGRVLTKKKSYENHLQSHAGENKCWCTICGKELSSRASLNYHTRSMHDTERTWHCQFCGKGYMSRQLQLVHERTHTGIKPFNCSVCSKSFSGANSLNQHMLKHSEFRNFECRFCSKRFQRKATLKVHLRTHTGEKPYICDICGHRFTQKNDMLKHQKTHRSTQSKFKTDNHTSVNVDVLNVCDLTCELCNSTFTCKEELVKHKMSHSVTVPIVYNVQNNEDVLSTITEIITDGCQDVLTLSNVETYQSK